jgi:hypothetical protein
VKAELPQPAVILAILALVSALLGTCAEGPHFGTAPAVGLYMVLAGVWFGLVIGYGVWRWGTPSWTAVASAVLTTWIGWEAAVNLALHLETDWLKAIAVPQPATMYVCGFAAGGLGALMTWFGAAVSANQLRQAGVMARVVLTGAVFGLLLPATSHYDNAIVLLLPWQIAVASVLGLGLSSASPVAATRRGVPA